MFLQLRPLIEAEGGQSTVGLGTERPERTVTAGQGMLSTTSQRTPTGSITFEEFIACDLPTRKRLGLIPPRVRLKIRVGDQTLLSPAVKVGNQPAGQSKSRTRWQGDFLEPILPIDARFEVMIERKFLVGYTCIRHIARTSTRRIKDGHNPPYSAFPLREGPPNRSTRAAVVHRVPG
ncbi:hypothetical protein L210DRAFT_984127 [Boletus edulis BED1]|uniref:Uncharacterized protein n=1 Tax=Boletus edulis BED1 TaxID=1328754 RepID=A0AAD4BF02_BOLED|nr:hypothetical protein L210DRAFT_984127 [Boletus edulis BED1]